MTKLAIGLAAVLAGFVVGAMAGLLLSLPFWTSIQLGPPILGVN